MLSQHILHFAFPFAIKKRDNRTVFSSLSLSKILTQVNNGKFVLQFIDLFDNVVTPTVLGVLSHVTCGPFVSGIEETPHDTPIGSISLANRCTTNKFMARPTFNERDFGKGFEEGIYW
jgi:hypothetical protein